MKNPNRPIHPCKIFCTTRSEQGKTNTNEFVDFDGLTKREYFAGLAMQSIIERNKIVKDDGFTDGRTREQNPKEVSKLALSYADEILEQLGEPHY